MVPLGGIGTGWEERPSNRTLQVMIRSVVSGGKVEEERDAIVCEDVKATRHRMARGMVYGNFIFVLCLLISCHLPGLNMRTSCV
jgi:hypothetical protein